MNLHELPIATLVSIALNPNTESKVLHELLLTNVSHRVKADALLNPNVSADTLSHFYRNINEYVPGYLTSSYYAFIAAHPNTPDETKRVLLNTYVSVRRYIFENINTGMGLIKERLQNDEWILSDEESKAIVANPNFESSYLDELIPYMENKLKFNRSNPFSIGHIANLKSLIELRKSYELIRNQPLSNKDEELLQSEPYEDSFPRSISIQGTHHTWHIISSFDYSGTYYKCGCFTGNRKQLLRYILHDRWELTNLRLALLNKLDETYKKRYEND